MRGRLGALAQSTVVVALVVTATMAMPLQVKADTTGQVQLVGRVVEEITWRTSDPSYPGTPSVTYNPGSGVPQSFTHDGGRAIVAYNQSATQITTNGNLVTVFNGAVKNSATNSFEMTSDAANNNVAWYGYYSGTPVAYGMRVTRVDPTSVTLVPTMCQDSSSHLLSTLGTLAGLIPIPGGNGVNFLWSLGTTIVGGIPEGASTDCRDMPTMVVPLRFTAGHTFAAPTTVSTTVDLGSHWPGPNQPGQICYAHQECHEIHKFTYTVQADTNVPNESETSTGPYPQTTYVPVGPARLIDSRVSSDACYGKLSSQISRTCRITGSTVPAGAVAVTGNLTVTQQSAKGYLYLGSIPMDYPDTSTLNFPVNDNRANNVTVPLDSTGNLSVTYVGPYSQVAGASTTHFIFDVTGYFTQESRNLYNPMYPVRLLDTRSSLGLAGPFVANTPRTLQIDGSKVPLQAVALTGNLTVVQASAAGFLSIAPWTTSSSTLNFPANEIRANGLTVWLPGSTLQITYSAPAGATADVLFDVTGYYLSSSGYSYVPIVPSRILDTRSGNGLSGKFRAFTARTVPVAGRAGIPSAVRGIAGNLTVTNQSAVGWLYIGPTATNTPPTSTLNFPVGDSRANGVTVGTSGGGAGITYGAASGATTDAILDVCGYYR